MASTGYNVMAPYAWLTTSGDHTGDANFQSVNGMEGDFFSQTTPGGGVSGGAAPMGAMVPAWSDISGMTTTGGVDATYSGYINAALMQPGSMAPVVGTPALVNGNPNNGPVALSDYAAGALPSQYLSPVPAWKNAPMQAAHASLPAAVQQTAAAASIASTPHNTHAAVSGGCAGCGGNCGGSGKRQCSGRNAPLGLDSTNDFLPLYSQPTANAAQAVGAALYHATSTKVPAWSLAQGAPADSEVPLQGQ